MTAGSSPTAPGPGSGPGKDRQDALRSQLGKHGAVGGNDDGSIDHGGTDHGGTDYGGTDSGTDGDTDVSERLCVAVESALGGWVERSVRRRLIDWTGSADPAAMAAAATSGRRAAVEVGAEFRRLLATDVDQQWTNPLSILRRAVRYPTAVLRGAGVPPIVRDAYDERHFPDDDYGLTPLTFADVDPSLHDLGLAWGATKARAHLARHGPSRRGGGPR